jgi:hypothetical protein
MGLTSLGSNSEYPFDLIHGREKMQRNPGVFGQLRITSATNPPGKPTAGSCAATANHRKEAQNSSGFLSLDRSNPAGD